MAIKRMLARAGKRLFLGRRIQQISAKARGRHATTFQRRALGRAVMRPGLQRALKSQFARALGIAGGATVASAGIAYRTHRRSKR